ncbi:MAG: 16S rRNA (guanine(527)-N(7))-methyltransferase RsmG [Thermodesulfovibrionales bacterium]|nr:16S rRNA (guanine(527)-N(7))-methyltransferase RsmG [Thermodesulfovibrionales bacterium]
MTAEIDQKLRNLFINGLNKLEIASSDIIISSFEQYLYELKKWNRAYNLTALKTDEDIIVKHFFDSLLYLKAIPDGVWSICDVGSGAGFPGIPVAIVRPELTITLIESSRKKCAFLRQIKKILLLKNTDVLEARVEDVKDRSFDIAVTRALFNVKDLIKKAGHILKKDGFFILNKGPRFEAEIKYLSQGVKFAIIKVLLPGTSLQRNLIKIYKL